MHEGESKNFVCYLSPKPDTPEKPNTFIEVQTLLYLNNGAIIRMAQKINTNQKKVQ
jgi:hypothetical protein